jgi:hypothetical protein
MILLIAKIFRQSIGFEKKPASGILVFATFLSLLCVVAFAQSQDTLDLSKPTTTTGTVNYINYAQKGSYENNFYVGEVPEWHYYDIFGNKLLDGFSLYGMGMERNSQGIEESRVALHPFMKKWFNGILQVGDITDKGGVLGVMGEAIRTHFTPYSFNQSFFTGARFDLFNNDFLGGLNAATILTSRISNTGDWGYTMDLPSPATNADWLQGINFVKRYKDLFQIGGTFINLHYEDGGIIHGNSLDGWDSDTAHTHTPSALSLFGFDGQCNLPNPKLNFVGEYKRSQAVLDGSFKPKAGNVATLAGYGDFMEKMRVGMEGYIVDSRFKTDFYDPAFPNGDEKGNSGRYLYSLVEDNDDKDDYPENGRNILLAIPKGDPDGVVPLKYDKNKNGRRDWEEDFLLFDCDPPKSNLYYDRNNNGIADEIEDDAYPDYTYVPSYYRNGEKYWRYDDMDRQMKEYTCAAGDTDLASQVSKGLDGLHLYGTYEIIPKLKLTLGILAEKSQENSYQDIYEGALAVGQVYAPEKATTLYSLLQYKKDFASDKNLILTDYFRIVKDNIPNHTLDFIFETGSAVTPENATNPANSPTPINATIYQSIVDQLDYRDAFVNMLIAQYSIFRNRGFNMTSRGKFEFTKHNEHLEYDYPGEKISSLILVNKCHYIWLLPGVKDMFLIPKYKNIYENSGYGGTETPRYDFLYRVHTMQNIAALVYEWKFTEKTTFTIGDQEKAFNDFHNADENYLTNDLAVQMMMKDRYVGLNLVLVTGVSKYFYNYYNHRGIFHNPFNNPHRIVDNLSSYDLFLRVYGGF